MKNTFLQGAEKNIQFLLLYFSLRHFHFLVVNEMSRMINHSIRPEKEMNKSEYHEKHHSLRLLRQQSTNYPQHTMELQQNLAISDRICNRAILLNDKSSWS